MSNNNSKVADLFPTLWGFYQQVRTGINTITRRGERTAIEHGASMQPLGPSSLTGTPSTPTPSIANYNRVTEQLDRQSTITDAWQLYYADPRVQKALKKRAESSVKGGWRYKAKPKDGVGVRVARRAEDEVDRLFRRLGLLLPDGRPNKLLLAQLLEKTYVEGDLFLQRVWDDDNNIIRLKSMPAISMLRYSDNADEFPDPEHAYGQQDVNTQHIHDQFSELQIYHGRWNWIPGDRYGNSELLQARATGRGLHTLERAQQVRRVSRSAPLDQYSYGDKDNPTEWSDVEEAKKKMGVDERYAQASADPYRQMQSVFDNGRLTIKRHEGDPNIDSIADIVYTRDNFSLSLGCPLQALGYGLENMQRDTLELILDQWLDSLEFDIIFIMMALWDLIQLQLRLKGINPDSLEMSLTPQLNLLGTSTDKANFIKTLSQNTMGAGMSAKPMPLITREKAAELLAPELGIEDNIDGFLEDLYAEMEEMNVDPDTVQEQVETQLMGGGGGAVGANVGSANSKNAGGGPTTGYGKKFEGGKPKDSRTRAPGEGYKK